MNRELLSALVTLVFVQVALGNQHRHSTEIGCAKCQPGHHVVKPCSPRTDTVCAPCEPNTYLPHNSYKHKCYVCSECGENLYIAHECTPVKDTICDSCHTIVGPKNENYQLRCAKYINPGESGYEPSDFESESELIVTRRTIPSAKQIGRLQHLGEYQEKEEEPSNSYLAMMLVGVGACALACLLTGIVVYSCYDTKKWKEGSSYQYKAYILKN